MAANKLLVSVFFIFAVLNGCKEKFIDSVFHNPFQNTEELSLSSEACILEGRHLWVSNEIQTVNPDLTGIGGISKVYSPPLNLSPFQLETTFFGKKVEPNRYIWKPGEIIQEAERNGVGIKCLLVPVYPETKIIQVIELSNSGEKVIVVPVTISANPALSRDSLWTWSPRNASQTATVKQTGDLCFETSDGEITIETDQSGLIKGKNGLSGEIRLLPKSKTYFTITVFYDDKNRSEKPGSRSVEKLIRQSRARWNERIEYAYNRLGRIRSSNAELDLFFKRGILTLLTCEWNKEEMLLQPYYAESGIDGGAVCSYLWGLAYVSRIMPLYNPQAWKEQIKQAIKTDAENHYAFIPTTGKSIGPWYSYNQYAMIRTIYDYVLITGDHGFLNEMVKNEKVIDYCLKQALYKDDINNEVKLINYGTNENLLELKKTGAYQFYVPSPNAERCWSYRAVDELCHLAGIQSLNLAFRAESLAGLITKELWSDEKSWFLTKDTMGVKHFSPCIQIFDILRCGILTKEQEKKILTHLNKQEFLSEYGVHSLSKEDPGYDLNDADWGGPGVYAGDAPELAEDLYQSGYSEKAEDVLKRILWWGKHLPYYPQAIIADKIDYRRNGRANIIAGVTATQSVLFGTLGLRFSSDGNISIQPGKTSLFDTLQLDGLLIHGKRTGITIRENNFSMTVDDQEIKNEKIGSRIFFKPEDVVM